MKTWVKLTPCAMEPGEGYSSTNVVLFQEWKRGIQLTQKKGTTVLTEKGVLDMSSALSGTKITSFARLGVCRWVQHKDVDVQTPFHYDKDEALAAPTDPDAWPRTVCPLYSTVTCAHTRMPSPAFWWHGCGAE